MKVVGISGVILAIGIALAISSANVGSALYFTGGILLTVGSLVFLVIGLFTSQKPPPQDSPVNAMFTFYQEVLCSGSFGNYGKAYQVLAPTATIQPPAASVAKLGETWSGVAKSLEAKTKESVQEEVSCSVCSKEGKGIRTSRWSQLWTLTDSDLLMYSRDDFILCDNCSAVYCASCYTKLKEKHSCKNCKSQLLNKPLKICSPTHHTSKQSLKLRFLLNGPE